MNTAAASQTSSEVLRLEHVSKRYGGPAGTLAVDDVSFAIRPGETLGLVGESGSGKTTIARLILRLDSVTSGRIWFAGRDLTHLPIREIRRARRDLQIVFQDPVASLNRRKTVGEIIEFPLRVHGPRDSLERKMLVDEVLDLAGLPRVLGNRYPHELSGGQGQRVGIARAIVLKPRLLVLDEAVSSLDVSIRAQVLNLLRDLQQQLGLTYLFISHDLSVVRYMSDQVGVMLRGRIVESGSRSSLFSNPQHPYTRELLAAVPADSARAIRVSHGTREVKIQ